MTVAVSDDGDLLGALKDPQVGTILLAGNVTMNPGRWKYEAVVISRHLEIRPANDSVPVVWDSGRLQRGVVVCRAESCMLTIRGPGLLFVNNSFDSEQTLDHTEVGLPRGAGVCVSV